MLRAIGEKLAAAGLVGTAWVDAAQARGRLVRLYRDYYEGQHRLKLTAEMRKMMQISDDLVDRYNANYAELVVGTMADRLTAQTVEAVDGQAEAGQAWVDGLLTANRWDALQIKIREAAMRDGVTYAMVAWDEAAGRVRIAHEEAWDGDTGCLAVYDSRGETLVAGVKIWWEGDSRRANLYYPAATEKYRADGDELALIETEDTSRNGVAPGVPLVAFKNKGGGRSELKNVIPLQDSLNRTLISMIMAAELTAFAILFAKGFKPPAALTPGMVINAMIEGTDGQPVTPESEDEARAFAALNSSYGLERIQGGDLSQLIGQAEFIIQQIGTVSSTPVAGMMGGDSQSGEALKQRDARLLGKIKRAQIDLGNSWEDVAALAAVQQSLFGPARPPAVTRWNAVWVSAEVRDEAEVRAKAKWYHDSGYERQALRVLGHSEAEIEALLAERAADGAAALTAAAGTLPGMGEFVA